MTEKEFCQSIEAMAAYMHEHYPTATDLDVYISGQSGMRFRFTAWDVPETGQSYETVKRRFMREGWICEDGWHFDDGVGMNEYNRKRGLLKEEDGDDAGGETGLAEEPAGGDHQPDAVVEG